MDLSKPQGSAEEAAALPSREQIRAQLLRMFRRELAETLRPELTSDYARNVANLLAIVLDHLIDWDAAGGYPEIDEARRTLLAALSAGGGPRGRFVPELDDGGNLDEALAEAVVRDLKEADPGQLARVASAVAAIDDRLYTLENTRHAEANRQDRTLMAEIDVDLTPQLFDRYAAAKLAITDDPTASILKIPGGNSKDTFLIKLDSGREFIVRRDFPFGPTETSAPDEYGLLDRLTRAGLPVARPIAAEYDRQYLGQPFLLVEKVEGVNALRPAEADRETGRFISFELARILAELHRLDPAALGFTGVYGDPRTQVAAYLASWRRWWDLNRIHPSSLGEAAFAWAERNIPEDIPRIVVVHGDARPDNMMFKDGRVTALLDWEFAHPGDPAEDLQYTKGYVEPFVTWEEFLDAYLAAGGAPVSEAGARFYDVFRSLRNMVCTDVSWSGFVKGKYPAFKLGSQGIIYKRMIAHALAKSLQAVTR
jgi:aminoglycoside phosphotransferase (APT) family kinase protein